MFNGSMHPKFDNYRTVSAEVLNEVLDKGASHIAYLKGANVIPSMRILYAYINAISHVRDSAIITHLEDEDIMQMVSSIVR